jgi:hypothetical protein
MRNPTGGSRDAEVDSATHNGAARAAGTGLPVGSVRDDSDSVTPVMLSSDVQFGRRGRLTPAGVIRTPRSRLGAARPA